MNRFAPLVTIGLSVLLMAGIWMFDFSQSRIPPISHAHILPASEHSTILHSSLQLTDSQLYLPLVVHPARLYLPILLAPAPTPFPTPTPLPGPDNVEEILIPSGVFLMGCDSNNSSEIRCPSSQQPLHAVYLDAYFIDKYEVTNARYKACVDAGGCTPPWSNTSYTRRFYYGNPIYDDYPVIRVDWYQAVAFCAWAGKRLPSEAEWEKAARGDIDTRKYPWGDREPDATLLNYGAQIGDTVEVGSYPSGASPYGVMDMAGNVWEWVNDWYSGGYYRVSPHANPPGPESGRHRVRRGGSWLNPEGDMRVAERSLKPPEHWPSAIGFRCVRTP